MLRPTTPHSRQAELNRPIAHVGDNLDRLLGLLERARVEQDGRARVDRRTSYRALAVAIASPRRVRARSCA